MKRLARFLVPVAGLALVSMSGLVLTPVVAPAGTECAGGICDVCPAVAKVLATTGAQIYCIA